MKTLLSVALFVTAVSSWSQSFYKVQIIFFRSNEGKAYNPPKQISITDKAEITKLTGALPGLGLSKGGLKPGGWDAWATIRLMRSKGAGIAAFVPVDCK